MLRVIIAIIALGAWAVASGAIADDEGAPVQAVPPADVAETTSEEVQPGGVVEETAPDASPTKGGDPRMRWHEGHWWYWLPAGKWVCHVDGAWVDYEQGMFRPGGKYYRPRSAARYSRRSYAPYGSGRYGRSRYARRGWGGISIHVGGVNIDIAF